MKRQIVFGFTGALIVGVFLVMGACNKHSFEDTEFNQGVKTLFQHHGEGEAHGEGAHGEGKAHDSATGAHSKGEDGDKHVKGHGGEKHDDSKKELEEASKQPAKTQFPKK